jgi:hypothetical protein
VAAVRRLVIDRLRPDQLDALGAAAETILDGLGRAPVVSNGRRASTVG